jgi:hypothetical protein
MKLDRAAWNKFIEEKNPLLVSCFKSIEHGLDHFRKRNKEDERRFCLAEMDQGIELFFKGILLRVGTKPYEIRFSNLLHKVKPILDISEAEETLILELHDERNRSQHEGKIPGSVETEHLVHSTLRFFLNKAEEFLGITPEDMTEMIPGLLTMSLKEAEIGEPPRKPDILKYLEDAATTFLVQGDFNLAFSQISLALQKFIDILYDYEGGHIGGFDPRNLIGEEITSLLPILRIEFKKLNLQFSKIPFDFTVPVELVPMTAYAIEELSFLRKKNVLDPEICERALKLLRLDLLHSMEPVLPRKIQRFLKKYFGKIFTFEFVISEFLFVRNQITSNAISRRVLDKYNEERNQAFFGGLKRESD